MNEDYNHNSFTQSTLGGKSNFSSIEESTQTFNREERHDTTESNDYQQDS